MWMCVHVCVLEIENSKVEQSLCTNTYQARWLLHLEMSNNHDVLIIGEVARPEGGRELEIEPLVQPESCLLASDVQEPSPTSGLAHLFQIFPHVPARESVFECLPRRRHHLLKGLATESSQEKRLPFSPLPSSLSSTLKESKLLEGREEGSKSAQRQWGGG